MSLGERVDLIHHSSVGERNLFPSDYKVGLYLPLLVCFAYPMVLSLKSLVWKSKRKQSTAVS